MKNVLGYLLLTTSIVYFAIALLSMYPIGYFFGFTLYLPTAMTFFAIGGAGISAALILFVLKINYEL